jgi:hypothetical protein
MAFSGAQRRRSRGGFHGAADRVQQSQDGRSGSASAFEPAGHDIMRHFFSVFLPVGEEADLAGTACANAITFCTSEKDHEVCEMV